MMRNELLKNAAASLAMLSFVFVVTGLADMLIGF
jgi:hypothetical protein